MAEIFKFFNSAPGDERWHYASDFADYFGSVLSSGLISNGDSPVGLQVTVNSGTMTTSVNVGKAIIKGYSYENTTPLTLTHSIPEQTLDRIDRVVLRLDLKNASRFIRVFIKEGVSALEPIPPTLQRDQYIYELSLAQVRIRKNTSSIVVSDIKDERADENLCGIVQSLITVPTSVFQQQFDTWFTSITDGTEQSVADWQIAQQQAFTMWFESIKGQLDGDVGAKLASDLTDHKKDLAHVHWIGTAVGTNTLTATYEPITTLKNGLGVAFLNATSSTLATTLNINNLGAIPILKANGNPVTNLKANGIYTIRYANGNFILQGEGGEYGTATASDVVVGKTIGTENGLVEGVYSNVIRKSSGVTLMPASAGGLATQVQTVDISGFNQANAIVFIDFIPVSYDASYSRAIAIKADLKNEGKLILTRNLNNSSGPSVQISWQIIEFANIKSIQKGELSLMGGSASASIASVNLSKSLLVFSFSDPDLTSDSIGRYVLLGELLQNSVRFTQYLANRTQFRVIAWQVIEFN